jgi:hypothetical protein
VADNTMIHFKKLEKILLHLKQKFQNKIYFGNLKKNQNINNMWSVDKNSNIALSKYFPTYADTSFYILSYDLVALFILFCFFFGSVI